MKILVLAHYCLSTGIIKNENIKGIEILKEFMQESKESKEILDEATSDIFAECFELDDNLLEIIPVGNEISSICLSFESQPTISSNLINPSNLIPTISPPNISKPSTCNPFTSQPSTPSTPSTPINQPISPIKKPLTQKRGRTPLKKKMPTKNTPKKGKTRERLVDLIKSNVLQPNQKVHFRSKVGQLTKDGKILFNEKEFSSPSQFTDHILRKFFFFSLF
jgi:hypothetical protein